jgi:hypothetical protein
MDTVNDLKAMTAGAPQPYRDKRLYGARKHQRDGICRCPRDGGTGHVGDGPCKLHGGCTPTVTRGAERQRADREARRALEGITDFEPVQDPVERLRIAGRPRRGVDDGA